MSKNTKLNLGHDRKNIWKIIIDFCFFVVDIVIIFVTFYYVIRTKIFTKCFQKRKEELKDEQGRKVSRFVIFSSAAQMYYGTAFVFDPNQWCVVLFWLIVILDIIYIVYLWCLFTVTIRQTKTEICGFEALCSFIVSYLSDTDAL